MNFSVNVSSRMKVAFMVILLAIGTLLLACSGTSEGKNIGNPDPMLDQDNARAITTLQLAQKAIMGNKQCFGPCNSITAFNAGDIIPGTSFCFPAEDTIFAYTFRCCGCSGDVVGWARGYHSGEAFAWKISRDGKINRIRE